MNKRSIRPLHEPADIYQVLASLKIGDLVPAQVLITDYKNGSIPPWIVREIEVCPGMLVLTVCYETAQSKATLFQPACYVAMDVFTLPTKTLAGPFYGYHPGCEHARNPLGDIRQHARQIVDRKQYKEDEAAA